MTKILMPLSDGVEETEAITVIDLLRRADLEVMTAALEQNPVRGSHNIRFYADALLEDVGHELYDMLILPGGPGTARLRDSHMVLNIVKKHYEKERWVCAICAAPTILQKAGISKGKKITSFPTEEKAFSDSTYLKETVVQDGKIITSRALGTAIPFALKLIDVLKGEEAAKSVAERIVYEGG